MKPILQAFLLTAESFLWIVAFVIVIFFDSESRDE